MCTYQGVGNVSFSENVACKLNELLSFCRITLQNGKLRLLWFFFPYSYFFFCTLSDTVVKHFELQLHMLCLRIWNESWVSSIVSVYFIVSTPLRFVLIILLPLFIVLGNLYKLALHVIPMENYHDPPSF